MSSKILQPDDPRTVEAVIWRQVGAAGPAAVKPESPPDPQKPDWQARLAEIEAQCGHRIREARAAGVREGEAAGKSRAAAEVQPVIERLSGVITDVAGLRPRLRKEAEADIVKLALAIARRVLRREIAVDADALTGLVMAALGKLQGLEICRVRTHPAHAPLIAECLRKSAPASAVEVISDSASQPGTVVFETGRGNLDASVETQLQEIERGLADRLRSGK
jgi:flagellar assembly protein FliH